MPILHYNHKLGKQAPRLDHRTLRLARYLTPKLAPAPVTCDWSKKVTNLGMMDNDTLGDCTAAAAAHQVQTWTANANSQVIISDADVVTFYERFGYNPADPTTDQGAIELDVLKSWKQSPFAGHALGAYASVDTQRADEVKQAIYLFGGCYIGVALPITAQSQDVWTVTSLRGDGEPGSWGGHAIPLIAYDATYAYCVTWGAMKAMSWSFFGAYADESYGLISTDWLESTGKCPDGFDLAQLQADLADI